MKNFRMAELLDAWDTLTTYTSYERTPKRQAWLRSSHDIDGSIDDWLENEFANVIEEYGKERGLSFDEAAEELKERPVKPWKASTKDFTEMVHLAVQGPKNITTIGVSMDLSGKTLESFAGMVRYRKPGKRYYVVTDTQPKRILYRWFVGEGFSHEEGWWVD